MNTTDPRLAALRDRLDADRIDYLLVQFVDLHGAAKVKLVPASGLVPAFESGAGFAGGAIWGMGQGPHSHDLMARIDLDSYTPLPYEPGVARFAAELFVDGEPHPYCPRVNLRRVLDRARGLGFSFNVGMEPEFFLVTRDADGSISGWDPDRVDDLQKPCYDYNGLSGALGFLRAMNDTLQALGWGVYQSDHEDANSQFEINFRYADALVTADRLTFFRMMAGQVARRFDAVATFMPKPFPDRTGSGAHVHFHLADAESGANLFVDEDDRRGLGISALGYHFLGGVLRHAPALCAVASPTVNCYKRLQGGAATLGSRSGYTWTPAFVSYGDNNRTQMIRTPEPGHFEDRTVSASCNPYLALAAYLSAGLDGVANAIDPGEPNRGNLYEAGPEEMAARGIARLPQSLDEALDAFEADPVVREALGPIADEFLRLKRDEWRDYHAQVDRWEIRRYLTAL
ncbi:type III glutamate--ammonia ligase [Tautonia plasticadhaerens]|uniref:Glutamine synthetase 3 n=1 Tax=Tautonia plasticadhaerens TaxID=2527974 RepID=A0A518H1F8_9BACT|nr:type III glutamate--ammonia ligase [Tautonia plasticadhaerens]QDV34666.1 Glutamine synthetase 3 [Tautonia plasticadhaerens]